MAEKRQALAVCLLIAIALVGTYFIIVDKSQFLQYSSASLNFSLQNQTDQPLDFSFFLHIASGGKLDFNNTETSYLHGNFTVWKISDGSGVEVDCNSLAPSDYLSFVTQQIKVTPLFQGIEDTEMSLSFSSGNLSDFDYNGVISLFNNQGISVGSRYYFNIRLNQYGGELRHYDRSFSPYLNALIAVTTTLFIGIVAMITWHRAKWFPIITVSILLVILFLYVFVGSGYEIFAKARNWGWLSIPFSVLLHGYDWHIFGNLVYFTVLSVLLESFLIMRGQPRRKDIGWWYFLPLFSPIFFIPIWQGFGLSLSIEAMTWTLWAYIIRNHDELITNKTRTFLAVLAGIPSSIFLGWVVSYSFGFDSNLYDGSEAFGHIFFGVASCVVVSIVAFRSEIRQKLKGAMSRIGRSMKESSKKE